MTNVNWERWARATGIVAVVLFIVAFIVFGSPPKIGDSGTKIASFFNDHRGRILTGVVIFGAGFVFLLWFVAAIASTLREAGKGGWGAATIGLAAAWVGIQGLTLAIAAGLSLNIAAQQGNDTVVQALNTLNWSADAISAFPLAGLIFAASIGLWRARVAPDWYGWIGMLAAVLVVLHATNWSTSGFWSPTGGYVFVTVISAFAWLVITSGLLYMKTAAAPMPERAAATPAP